jgi:hypothetical protein
MWRGMLVDESWKRWKRGREEGNLIFNLISKSAGKGGEKTARIKNQLRGTGSVLLLRDVALNRKQGRGQMIFRENLAITCFLYYCFER